MRPAGRSASESLRLRGDRGVTNLASRLADEAAAGQILISQRLYAEVEDDVDVESAGEFTSRVPADGRGIQRHRHP